MNIVITSVYDSKVKAYSSLIPARTVEEAIRGFKSASVQPESDFNKFPEDYSLWNIGTFDQETGVITGAQPTMVAQALEFKQNNM